MPNQDIIGMAYGRLTVMAIGVKGRCVVACKCGRAKETRLRTVVSGKTMSCGCLARERAGDQARTHGKTKTLLYRVWANMVKRCVNPNHKHFACYGGRGIAVCGRWRHSFETFAKDIGDRPTPTHTLDRINVDGDYTPDNCRWATRKEQAHNRRTNVYYTHGGETYCLAEWSRRIGLSIGTLRYRLKHMPFGQAICKPMHQHIATLVPKVADLKPPKEQ